MVISSYTKERKKKILLLCKRGIMENRKGQTYGSGERKEEKQLKMHRENRKKDPC